MEKTNRITGLDLCKVLGALLVIYYHFIFPYPPDILGAGGVLRYGAYFLYSGMSICVPLFFLVSGALTLGKDLSLKRHLRRCVHVVFLLVFWAVFSLGLILLMRGTWCGAREFLKILRDLRVGYIQHLWFLTSYFALMLLAPVLCVLRKYDRRTLMYLAGVIFLFTFGDKLLNDGEYLLRWVLGKRGYAGNRSFFGYINYFVGRYWYVFVYFILGYVVLEQRDVLKPHKKWVVITGVLMFLGLGITSVARCVVKGEGYDSVFYGYPSVFTLGLSLCVFLLLCWWECPPWLGRFAEGVSRVSLGIYLIHWLLIEAIKSFLPGLMGNHALAPVLAVAVFFLSYGISLGLSRVPLLRKLIQI